MMASVSFAGINLIDTAYGRTGGDQAEASGL
jgi:hypothetical protein